MSESDANMLARATGGDDDALSALLQRHGPRVRRELAIGKQYQSLIDPDDVMQVTYVEAFARIGGFTPTGPEAFLAWLRADRPEQSA